MSDPGGSHSDLLPPAPPERVAAASEPVSSEPGCRGEPAAVAGEPEGRSQRHASGFGGRSAGRRSGYGLLAAASIVVIAAGLRAAASVLIPLALGALLSVIVLPFIRWLEARRVPRVVAVSLSIVSAAGVLIILVLLVTRSIREFTAEAPRYQARIQALVRPLVAWLELRGFELENSWAPAALASPGAVLDLVTTVLGALLTVLSNALFVLLALVFLLIEAYGLRAKLEAAFGTGAARLDRLAHVVGEVQHYLLLKTLVSAATGGLIGITLVLFGIKFALLWGILAFLLNFIPVIGSIIAAVPPLLLALVEFGLGRTLALALLYLVINIFLSNFVEPLLMGRRLGLSVLVVFLSLMFWGLIWGPVGMLLSVPLTTSIKILLDHTIEYRWVAVLLGSDPRSSPSRPAQRA